MDSPLLSGLRRGCRDAILQILGSMLDPIPEFPELLEHIHEASGGPSNLGHCL
jgi:hypothetical protein